MIRALEKPSYGLQFVELEPEKVVAATDWPGVMLIGPRNDLEEISMMYPTIIEDNIQNARSITILMAVAGVIDTAATMWVLKHLDLGLQDLATEYSVSKVYGSRVCKLTYSGPCGMPNIVFRWNVVGKPSKVFDE